MLEVKINQNIILSKAEKNDKGTLRLVFRDKREGEGKKKNLFESSMSAEVEDTSEGSQLLLFPFQVPKDTDRKTYTQDEKLTRIGEDINQLKNQLTHILQQYTTNIAWNPYEGTGINAENYAERYLDNNALLKVYDNYVTQFIKYITPFLDDDKFAMRLKLIRQSKDKHYPTLPGKFIQSNPFMEPMDVPEKDSKLKYTPWEIQNKLNDGNPVDQNTADAIPDAPPSATNIFGARG